MVEGVQQGPVLVGTFFSTLRDRDGKVCSHQCLTTSRHDKICGAAQHTPSIIRITNRGQGSIGTQRLNQ